MISSSFFTRVPTIRTQKVPEYHFIDVGREQFHALAVALIDYCKSSAPIQEMVLKNLLERFFGHYPHYKIHQSQLTATAQMHRLINSSRKSELVECMAFVLRQLTVDELYHHPLNYPEVFAALNQNTAKDYLRQPQVLLPSFALSALAHILKLPLTLLFREPGKELPVRERYANPAQQKMTGITLEVQGNYYFPGVKHKEEFTFVGQLAIHPPEPIMDEALQDRGTMEDIFHTLDTENQTQLQTYEHWRHVLLGMVKTGELTKEQLLSLYTKWLPDNTRKAKFLVQLARQKHPHVVDNSAQDSNQHLLLLLIETLASWISVKAVHAEQLFDEEMEVEMEQSFGLK